MNEFLHILQHALGLDQYGQGSYYRNRFVTGPGSTDFAACMYLAEFGLMKHHGSFQLIGGDHYFQVTETGKRWVKAASPKPPKLTRSQKRYRQWLKSNISCTFAEWLMREKGSKDQELYRKMRLGSWTL